MSTERVRHQDGRSGTVLDAIGGVPAGVDHEDEWCLPVQWDGGRREFVRLNDLGEDPRTTTRRERGDAP